MPKVLFLDFDGVLAIKWTIPELHFPQIPSVLSDLREKGHLLCVVSYNPQAERAIREWNLYHYFEGVRAGCNQKWFGVYKDCVHRPGLSKAEQILDLIRFELHSYDIYLDDCIFCDDDVDNINLVTQKLPAIKTVLIDENIGLTHDIVNHL